MTSDPEDALRWDGDEERGAPSLPEGWRAVGKGSRQVASSPPQEPDAAKDAAPHAAPTPDAAVDAAELDDAEPVLSTPALVGLGVLGGIYLLYSVGWFLGGTGLLPRTVFLVPEFMYIVMMWIAVLAPWLWFAASWVLTRRAATWVRLAALIAGAVLLVPWPFLMTGAGA